jgi:hypothetical protein
MAPNPKATGDRLTKLDIAWEKHAANVTFAGMTRAQYNNKVKPSLDARARVAELKQELAAAIVERENADIISSEVALQVVNSVKGDPNHGEDSPLYDALGYVRKSARKSGLTRTSKDEEKKAA